MNWKPSSTFKNIKYRAEVLRKIRSFFYLRDVLEVDTPIICHNAVTDVNLDSFSINSNSSNMYLQTSPEYYMKRLLSAGYGSIFQICKCFRDEESSFIHNREFTLLEWYQINYDHHDLIVEVIDLIYSLVGEKTVTKYTYDEVFNKFIGCSAFDMSLDKCNNILLEHNINHTLSKHDDISIWQQLILSSIIEKKFIINDLTFVYDFPINQAALARKSIENSNVAHRFEMYWQGMELANGFYELSDREEQQKRFYSDNILRKKYGKSEISIDNKFLDSLDFLPDCSGVALGIDRLLMCILENNDIEKVICYR